MHNQSTQNVYTFPNDTNIGINVTIQYMPSSGDILAAKPENFQVLLHNKESSPEQIQSSLNGWINVVKSGELKRMTDKTVSGYANNQNSFNFSGASRFIERVDGFKNCIPSNQRVDSKSETIAQNLEGILRSYSQKLSNKPNSHAEPESRSSIFNVESLFGSPTDNKNKKCEKQIPSFSSAKLNKNEYSPSLIDRSFNEINRPFHVPKPISLKLFPNSLSTKNNNKAQSISDDRTNETNGFVLLENVLSKSADNTPVQKVINENCMFAANRSNFSEKIKEQFKPKIEKKVTSESFKHVNSGIATTSIHIPNLNLVDNMDTKTIELSRLSKIFNLFERYYLEGIYDRDIVMSLSQREQLILLKIIKVNENDIVSCVGNQEYIVGMADKYFSHDAKRKGYKITNNKRFIFRKIRSILYKNIQDAKTNMKGSKKARDTKFYLMYFQNSPEYARLSPKERINLKSLLRTYEESKIGVIWKFSQFSEDFSKVFFEFPNQMADNYYKKKLNALKFYLEFLNDKDEDYILNAPVPIKSLPRPLTAIKQYMVDFYNSFGEHLKKSN